MSKSENKNALKHGAFSQALILPGEDPNDLQELLTALRDEWNPEGPSENDKIESIAICMWRKRRFRTYLRNSLAKNVRIEAALEQHRNRRFETLLDFWEEIEESDLPGSVTEESLTEKVGPFWADQFKTRRPRKNYDSDEAWLKAICEFIAAIQDQRFTPRSDELPPLDEELSTEEFANREQDFEERIDAKIDRDIKQLGQIKTMKAIGIGRRPPAVDVGPLKQIEAPSIQAVDETNTT